MIEILGGGEIDQVIQEQMASRHGGDMMNALPSISVTLANVRQFLTWREAYNVGVGLIRTANTAHYG